MPFDIPPSQPRQAPREPAREIIERLQMESTWFEHSKKTGEVMRILVSTPFGVHHASKIQSDGPHLLQIVIRTKSGDRSTIFCHADQCAFMVETYVPTPEKPEERVILGFGSQNQNQNA
jgi:hypothetical protein